jgi:hypothetical protein
VETARIICKQYDIAFMSTSANKLVIVQHQTGVKDAIAQLLLELIMKHQQLLQ